MLNDMTIEYYTKNVYGREHCYIAKPEIASNWEFISGRKTITDNDMHVLENLFGAYFKEIIQPK